MLFTWSNLSAQTHVWDPAALTDGTIIILESRTTDGGEGYLFNGDAVKSSTLNSGNFFIVEREGDVINLKRKNDNKYVGIGTGNDPKPVVMVDAAEDAYDFTVSNATPNGTTGYMADTDRTKMLRFQGAANILNTQGAAAKPSFSNTGALGKWSVWYVYTYTEEEVAPYFPVTDLSQLSNEKRYFIKCERSFLLYSSNVPDRICTNIGEKVGSVTENHNDPNQQFRIEKDGTSYYLYSIGAGKYVSDDGTYVDTKSDAMTFSQTGNATYPWKLSIGTNCLNSQGEADITTWSANSVPRNTGIVVNAWGYNDNTKTDAGNSYCIEEVFISDADVETFKSQATSLANILGVELPEITAEVVMNAGGYAGKYVYSLAANNVYRIVTAGSSQRTGKAIGIYTDETEMYKNGVPAGVDNPDAEENSSSAPDQLWRFASIDNGIKLVNLNREAAGLDATIAQAVGGGPNPTPFTTLQNGGLFSVTIVDEANKVIRFDGSRDGNDGLNMEPEARKFHLSKWRDNNAQFTIQKIDEIKITLKEAESSNWASAYLPFGVSETSDDVELLTGNINSETGNVTMSTTDNVAAKNGFVIKGIGATATLTIDNGATATSGISGSTVATTSSSSIYVLGVGATSGKLGFYNMTTDGTAIAANKAFIESAAGIKGFVFDFGEATAIESVEANTNDNGAIYDLSGRRVQKTTKGLYIINGKKVIR